MFLDRSAIVEYFVGGPDYDRIATPIETSRQSFSTAPAVMFEAACVLASRHKIDVREAVDLLEDFLAELRVEVLPATRETALAAIDAFSRYGKGRHPAKLNFGDCFVYAGAKAARQPLLYVGNDFALTDLA